MEHPISATEPSAVQVEQLPGGASSAVWLRKNIEQQTADNGPEGEPYVYWECDELSFTTPGTPTAEEVSADFDALWEEHADDRTPAEKAQDTADAAQAQADYTAALTDTLLPE